MPSRRVLVLGLTLIVSWGTANASHDYYLLAGSRKCVSVKGGDPLTDNLFLIAHGNRRSVLGRSYRAHDGIVEHFRLVCHDNTVVGFESDAILGRSLLESRGRALRYLLLEGDQIEPSEDARFHALQVASFSHHPIALFFSSDYLGLTRDQVWVTDRSAGTETTKVPCGTLTLTWEGGLQRVQFHQSGHDWLTARLPDFPLRDYNTKPFTTGLTHVLHDYQFDPPLTSTPSPPWTVRCRIEQHGVNGKVYQATYRVDITDFFTDVSRIEEEIDRILAIIPEGQDVQSSDRIAYTWKNETVVRSIDEVALSKARGLTFSSGRSATWRYALITGAGVLALAALGGLWFWRRR